VGAVFYRDVVRNAGENEHRDCKSIAQVPVIRYQLSDKPEVSVGAVFNRDVVRNAGRMKIANTIRSHR
jgi:hypothetical protein